MIGYHRSAGGHVLMRRASFGFSRKQALPASMAAAAVVLMLLLACSRQEKLGITPPRPAKIVFPVKQHDFGRVEQGTRVHHAFHFTNEGEQDLGINDLRTARDCLARVVGRHIVPPGGSAAIEVDFDTEKVFGQQRRTVTVYSNDPDNIFTLLVLTGDVALDVGADPPQLWVGALPAGTTFWREIYVLTDGSTEVLSVSTDGNQLVARSEPLADGRKGYRIDVTIAGDAVPGLLNDAVLVRTTSSRRPLLRIPVTGKVIAPSP